MGKQCRFLDEDDCYFGFAYTVKADGQLEISTQKNKGWHFHLISGLLKFSFHQFLTKITHPCSTVLINITNTCHILSYILEVTPI